MVDVDCRGCIFFKVRTQQVLEDNDWKLDIKMTCEIEEHEFLCKKKLESM